jgi:hypothetical protein
LSENKVRHEGDGKLTGFIAFANGWVNPLYFTSK